MNTNSSTGGKLSVNVGKIDRIASIAAALVYFIRDCLKVKM
jgi:hypothetical protein